MHTKTDTPFLTEWIRNACSMEMGLVSLLEQQTRDEQAEPRLRRGLDRHLQATRRHVELLGGCLERMGDDVSSLRATNPIERMYGPMQQDGIDPTLKIQLLDFVTENFESASYRAIGALAQKVGDAETSRVCQSILSDELAVSRALNEMLPVAGLDGIEVLPIEEESVAATREAFAALNRHDLDAFERLQHAQIEVEAPGAPDRMDKQQYVDYLRNFIDAFPDLHFDIGRMIAEDGTVVTTWTCIGTHRGPFHTPDGLTLAPRQRPIHVPGSSIIDLSDGLCVRAQIYWDTGTLMTQLGGTEHK